MTGIKFNSGREGWWNAFYRWWKRSIRTKGQFNSIRSVEAFKCLVAWVG